jgi:hypothetical protein
MTKRIGVWAVIGAVIVGLLFVGESISQQAGDTQGGRGGRRAGGRGGFDPEQIRKRMAERLKETLGATDEEWKVLEPKIEKVIAAGMEVRGGGMGMMGRTGRGPGGDRGGEAATSQPAPTTETGKTSQALAKVLANKEAKADEIKTALQALRDARAKAKAELEKAQKELRDVLTVRQEAQFVMTGMLE